MESKISEIMKRYASLPLTSKLADIKVWYNGLLAKLRSKRVSGMLLTWLWSYLDRRSIKVVLSGQSSDASPINASVAQGCILCPLLFSVFIDDVVDTCENQLYLYADDSTLFAAIRSVNARESVFTSLNRDRERMRVWAAKWKVTALNPQNARP